VLGIVGACLWLALGQGGVRAAYVALGFVLVGLGRRWTYGRALARLGFDRALGAYQMIGALLVGLLILNSARAHLATGRVEWKGRHYATKGPR